MDLTYMVCFSHLCSVREVFTVGHVPPLTTVTADTQSVSPPLGAEREQLGVQCLVRLHLNTWTSRAGDLTPDHQIEGQPAPPSDPQLPSL